MVYINGCLYISAKTIISYELLYIFKSFCFSVFLCVLNKRSLSNIDINNNVLPKILLKHICLGNVICIQLYNIQIGSVREGVVGIRILCGVITISSFHHSLVCFDPKMFREKSVHHHRMFFLLMLF